MKHTTRIICTILAVCLLASVMLTGCSMPKPTLPGTGKVAATYGNGQEISTGEYLAYLYMNFNNIYQNYYYYEQYGMDPWEQTVPYDNADGETENLALADYIVQSTQDSIKRQIVLDKMLKDNGLSWLEDEKKSVDAELAEMTADAYLDLGFSNENFTKAYQALVLNEWSLFMGLYGKDGVQEVTDKELKGYFDENYLSYKAISVSLTDSEGKELDKDKKAAELKTLNGYLDICKKDGFEKAMDAYNAANAEKDEKVEASSDEDNRVNADATTMDENLVKVIRDIKVGEAKVVEYKAGGSTPTAVLIQRLDPNKPESVYTDAYEDILTSIKYEDFNEDVEKAMAELDITFNEKTVKKCDPKDFLG